MENKGLNFLAGLGGLWLIWKLYSIGWFHTIGFLAINTAFGSSLVYHGDVLYNTTPLALLAALLIDAVAIFGSLLIIFASGIWDILLYGGKYLADLTVTLKEYLEDFRKDVTPAPLPVDPVDPVDSDPVNPVEEELNPLEVILLEIKTISDNQKSLVETQIMLNENQNALKVELDGLKGKTNE